MQAFNLIRLASLEMLDLAQDGHCVIDSLPIPVVQFHWALQASSEWKVRGARFGKCASKQITIFGYKLHTLTTLNGVIIDFVLAPANEHDLMVGYELLTQHHNRDVLGDKGAVSHYAICTLPMIKNFGFFCCDVSDFDYHSTHNVRIPSARPRSARAQ